MPFVSPSRLEDVLCRCPACSRRIGRSEMRPLALGLRTRPPAPCPACGALLTRSRPALRRQWLSLAALFVVGTAFVIVGTRAVWADDLATLAWLALVGGPVVLGVALWMLASLAGLRLQVVASEETVM